MAGARRATRPAARALLAVAMLLAAGGICPSAEAAAFLEDQLPLKLTVVTPSDIVQGSADASTTMYGSSAIQVVFSRPAIALGSDFGEGSAKGKFPFSLDCKVPGKMRWVTTAIARYDPDISWPTDLDCTLVWNTAFKSYDGASLQLGDAPLRRKLGSSALSMAVGDISSDMAEKLTDGQWDGSNGLDGDKLPEMPPDGKMVLIFNNDVNLQMLKDALKMTKDESPNTVVAVEVAPCWSPLPGTPVDLNVNASCAQVTLKGALEGDTYYTLELPKGSRYHALSGPLAYGASTRVAGLRPFRIPLQPFNLPEDTDTISYDATQYRRMQLWLPHGLAEGTKPSQLLPLVSLCQFRDGYSNSSACAPVRGLKLDAIDKGMLLLTVPSLQPMLKYRISVAASASVKDGFGLPLLESSTEFWTRQVPPAWQGPSTPYTAVILEDLPPSAPGDALWRYAVRPQAKRPSGGAPPTRDATTFASAQVWPAAFGSDAELMKLMEAAMGSSVYVPEVLGKPALEVPMPAGNAAGDWQEVALALPGPSSVHVVAQCCDKSYWPVEHDVSAHVKLLFRTNLSLSAVTSGARITAWLLDSQSSAPVQGAAVRVVATYWDGNQMAMNITHKCTTGADGTCSIDASKLESGTSITLFASYGSQAAILGQSYISSLFTPGSWLASLVADRLVVVPGDSLKVTGFVQAVSPSGKLSLPKTMQVPLTVSPPFVDGQNAGPILATLDADAGTLHAEVPVPAGAAMSQYSLYLSLPGPEDKAGQFDNWWGGGGASLYFTVADPRPPTAELRVSAPSWTKPGGKVKVDVTAVSYIGASVDGAEMTLTWSHALAKGQVALTTDVNGAASAVIDLGDTKYNRTTAGDSVSVEVEWVGPTRERLTQSLSVSVQDAARVMSLSRSLDTKLPGVKFGVKGRLLSSSDRSDINGVNVMFVLKPNATNGPDANSAACKGQQLVSSCQAPSGAGFNSCQLALPCPGVFVLEACAAAGDAPDDGKACASDAVGWSEEVWGKAPWKFHDNPDVWTDKPSYSIGDTAVLSFQNPWPGARALVAWGNVNAMHTVVVRGGLPSNGVASVSIKLGSECTGGCGVSITLDMPRVARVPYAPGQGPIPGVAVSRLFDPLGPHTHTMSTSLDIAVPNSLDVAVAVGGGSGTTKDVDGTTVPTVEPGAKAQVTVDVKVPGAGGAAGAEVTLYAVDESFLALAPYPLPRPQADMVLSLAASFGVNGPDALRLAPKAVVEVFAKLMARLTGIDPWLPVDTTCFRQQEYFDPASQDQLNAAAVDTIDAEYIKRYTTMLTYSPGNGYRPFDDFFGGGGCWRSIDGGVICGMASASDPGRGSGSDFERVANSPLSPSAMRGAPPPPPGMSTADHGGQSNSGDSSGAVSVRVQEDFLVTPLFANAKADASGRATFTFTAPQNLGSFALRAFAASGSAAKYGSGEGKVVVKRRLSLTPSLPRFVRVGDAFEAGVIVTVGSAPASVAVTAKVEGAPLALGSSTAKQTATFAADGGVQQEIRFKFSAKAIGTSKITITAVLAGDGGASDGLELELDVLGQQGDVWVATSFAVAANGSEEAWQEGLELPAAVAGSGGLALTAGIGYFPTIDGFYSSLQEQEKLRDVSKPTAHLALLWAVQPAVYSYYGRGPNANQSEAIARAFKDLKTLTDEYGRGLRYRIPDDVWIAGSSRPDLWLQLWGVYLMKRHQEAFAKFATTSLTAYAAQWAALQDTSKVWLAALGTELVQQAADARNSQYYPGPFSGWNTLAWTYYVLGKSWKPPTEDAQLAADLSFARLLAAASNKTLGLDTETKVLVSLALIAGGDARNALVTATVKAVTNRLRVQGRTAYVAYDDGAKSPDSLDSQALYLLLLLETSQTHLLVPKLAAYVANPFRSSGRYDYVFSPSYYTMGEVSAALAEYDTAKGSAKPALELVALAGNNTRSVTVLEASFTPTSNAPVSNTTAWEDLLSPPGDLLFQATGSGEVSIAASLHFVPAKLLPYPSYRGIYVESAIQLLEPFTGSPTGKPLKTIPLASVVAYTVQITTPDDLGAVTISVMMPGGLEPLDPNVPGSSGGINGPGSYCPLYGFSDYWRNFYYRWWWPICPTQETRPSVVTFNYDALMAGTNTVVVKAVAASVGSFVLPPVRAYADQQPEVMGMTGSGAITICQGCKPGYAPAGPALKACPANCSGNGVCNPISGACTCDADYSGEGCSSFTVVA